MSDRVYQRVEVVGSTTSHVEVIQKHMDLTTYDGQELLEFAGRNCYLSFNKPNPYTRDQDAYLAHIIGSGHLSVLEHVSVTFYVTGVSRTLLAELTRHRHLGFSVVSQRYVGPDKFGWVMPPLFTTESEAAEAVMEVAFQAVWEQSVQLYDSIYNELIETGWRKKQAREAARSVLPGMAETRMVVTGNLRTWREIIQKRNDPAADAEIQELAGNILTKLYDMYPAVFNDLYDKRENVS